MSKVCSVCGKRHLAGNMVSHSLRHTRRVRAPNLQRVHAIVDGRRSWIRACTRCIKSGRVTKAA
ncbi:MAG: 50S ribosomal protein L28 [Candidatus Bipolaricaulota bacterium]|nr:50S ribosomal protein L28 [Candidatus Bipolaricaulota bacterium]